MLFIDDSEPSEIEQLLHQSVPVTRIGLNRAHCSDYAFSNYDGKKFQFSRKQAGELVGNLDEAEDQLRDYYNQADENFQIVEGIISPVQLYMQGNAVPVSNHSDSRVSSRELGAKLYCYQVEPTGFIERGHSFSAISASILYAWIHRLAEVGITTYWTLNWAETAKLLAVIYRNEQKPPEEHHTLKRVIRPRIAVKDAEPFMKAILYLSAAYKLDIGEKKATVLVDRFVNLIDIATADVSEISALEGFGKKSAEKLLTALGRTL